MEGLEGNFEVYDIVSGGLDRVVVENCVLVWLGGCISYVVKAEAYNCEYSVLISLSASVGMIQVLTPILGFPVPVLW